MVLRALVALRGWPTAARFGEQAQAAAGCLLAASARIDPAFQNSCLAGLALLRGSGEVDAGFYALTVDRALVSHGRRQRYGTRGSSSRAAGWSRKWRIRRV